MRSLGGYGQGQEDLIERLCRESGRWRIGGREAGRYRVHAVGDHRPLQYVNIRSAEQWDSLAFQSWFPIRFPLDNPPSGLFARLLMRSFGLRFAAWTLDMTGSCEASLCVVGRLPVAGVDAPLFDLVCRELVDEVLDFHDELRSKFRYGVGEMAGGIAAGPAVPEVRFIEPVQHHASPHGRYRILPGQGS